MNKIGILADRQGLRKVTAYAHFLEYTNNIWFDLICWANFSKTRKEFKKEEYIGYKKQQNWVMIEGQEIAMEQPSSMKRNLEVLDELKAYVLSSNETVERQLETSKSQNKVKRYTVQEVMIWK